MTDTAATLLPRPTAVQARATQLALDGETAVFAPGPARPAGDLLRTLLVPPSGLPLAEGGPGSAVRLVLDDSAGLRSEGYRLSVDGERALLVAGDLAGLRNGAQTLRQLLGPEAYRRAPLGRPLALPGVEIEDAPRFAWRGGHLDVSRHFMPAPFLLRFVDLLAVHKLNVLHLHLNDDQGWRFPSSRFPRLTEVGGWRAETLVGHSRDQGPGRPRYDGTPHGGSYSLEDLSELVAYAAERGVTVVPEIDLPGHAQAAIAAYPELGSATEPLEVWPRWGISEHVLNLSPSTVELCRQVWGEVLEVFPSLYVHIGGDECPRKEWRETPAVQERIAELGLPDAEALQSWFTGEMSAFLQQAGRRPVGWDEILEGGELPAGATVMSWRGEQGGITAARAGFDVVMCPESPCYFDHYQSGDPEEPLAIHGLNSLEQVYAYEPVPAELEPEHARHVLGTQFQCWSEYLPTPEAVEYAAFPRAAALAEVAWSSGPRQLEEFLGRLGHHLARLDALGVNYRPLEGPHPWQRGGTGPRRRFDQVR